MLDAQAAVDRSSLLPPPLTPAELARKSSERRMVTSRAAEHLFWLGRYTERAENSLRLARHGLQALGASDRAAARGVGAARPARLHPAPCETPRPAWR